MERHHGAEVVWLPFDLHPEIPDEGTTAERLFGPRFDDEVRMRYRERLKGLADEVGLPFDPPEHIPRTRFALETSDWVRRERPGHFRSLHRSLFGAYWGEGRDIGDPEVVLDLAERAGLRRGEVQHATEAPETRGAVDASTREAVEVGVTGTPAWLIDGRLLVPGAQPRETFDRIIERMAEARG